MPARQIRDSILKWYLIISGPTAVISLAYDVDTMLHGFANLPYWDWTAYIGFLWMPVSLVAVVLALMNRRPLVAAISAAYFVYMFYSVAIVVVWALMDPHHVKIESKVPQVFIYLDIVFECLYFIGVGIAFARFGRPQRRKDEGRLITLEEK